MRNHRLKHSFLDGYVIWIKLFWNWSWSSSSSFWFDLRDKDKTNFKTNSLISDDTMLLLTEDNDDCDDGWLWWVSGGFLKGYLVEEGAKKGGAKSIQLGNLPLIWSKGNGDNAITFLFIYH